MDAGRFNAGINRNTRFGSGYDRNNGNHDFRGRNISGSDDNHHNAMKQSSKRLMSVFIAFIFILASFILFFDLVQPAYSNMKTLQSQQLGEQNYLQNQASLVKAVQAAINTYKNEAQGAANVGLAMPSGQDIAGGLTQIEGIAANNSIVIGNIDVSPPALLIAAKTAGASASSTLVKPLGSFTFKIVASGSYESFKNFLSELETNIRIFDVKTISLQSTNNVAPVGGKPVAPRDLFSYTMTVATYYQTQ